MKTIIYSFLAIITFQFTFGQTFTQLNSGTTNILSDLYFLDASSGYVVGYSKVLKTTDGGSSWTDVSPSVNVNFADIYMENIDSGFIVGLGGTILRTLDGGSSWHSLNVGTSENIRRIIKHNNAWYLTGGNGLFKKTTDFGDTWTNVNISTSDQLFELEFVSNQVGFVAGDNGTMFKTTDGGVTWNMINSNTNIRLLYLEFTDPSNGIGVGATTNNVGVIIRTSDGGNTWTANTQQNSSFQCAAYVDNQSVYVVGGNQVIDTSIIYHSTNGGQNWDFIDLNTNRQMGIQIIDDVIYTCGLNGTIFKSTLNTGTAIRAEIVEEKLNIYPNPSSYIFNIDIPELVANKDYTLRLLNTLGQVVFESTNSNLVDATNLSHGTYTLILEGENKVFSNTVIVK